MHAYGIGDLHLTDSHGKGGLAKYIANPDAYVMSEVQRVVNHGRKNGIKHFILYGDVCEEPRMSYEATLALTDFFEKNKESEFHVIVGNHDKFAEDSAQGHSLQIIERMGFKNVRIYTEPEIVKIDGTKVHMHPWPSTAFSKKLLNIAHVEVKGSKSDSGRAFDGEEFSKSRAVTAMGHLHTNHQVRNTYYSGTLYQTNFGESLPKFFHHINFNSVDDYSIDSVPFEPKYKLHTCIVSNLKELRAIPKGEYNLVKLIIEDGSNIAADAKELSAPNIVIHKAFKTKQELQMILTEDLASVEELVISTDEFFKKWVKHQKIPKPLYKRALELRASLFDVSA